MGGTCDVRSCVSSGGANVDSQSSKESYVATGFVAFLCDIGREVVLEFVMSGLGNVEAAGLFVVERIAELVARYV